MDQSSGDVELNNLKLELKSWEAKFVKENGRKPSQGDISRAPIDVQDMYRKYFKLKKLSSKNEKSCTTTESPSALHCDIWSSKLNKVNETANNTFNKMNARLPFTSSIGSYVEKMRAKQKELRQNKSLERTASRSTQEKANTHEILSMKDEPIAEANFNGIFKPLYKVKVNDVYKDDNAKLKPLNAYSKVGSQSPLPNMRGCLTDQTELRASSQLAIFPANETIIGNAILTGLSGLPNFDGNVEGLDHCDVDKTCKSSLPKCINQKLRTQSPPSLLRDKKIEPILSDKYDMANKVERLKIVNDIFTFNDDDDDVKDLSPEGTFLAHRKLQPLPKCQKSSNVKVTRRPRTKSLDKETGSEPARKKLRLIKNGDDSSQTPSNRNKRNALPKENYVRINLKKRVFVRGKNKFNFRRYKYNNWLKRKRSIGHNEGGDKIDNNSEPEPSRTNEELSIVPVDHDKKCSNVSYDVELNVTPEAFGHDMYSKMPFSGVEPVFELINNEASPSALEEIREVLKLFGHDNFRNGQIKSVTRILAGLSTLLIQPTGSGKSLCYLLPAYMYAKRSPSITLVISPLVSLMEDQVERVPSCLKAACIHTNMTAIQREKVRRAISNKKIDVLFLSPEALAGAVGSSVSVLPPDMAPIAFVCIDEVHCVSAWSHNFRPSYLRLCRIIRETLKVKCILGLTATATNVAIESIVSHLDLTNDTEAVIRGTVLPLNLRLTVSRDHREEVLMNLLNAEPYSNFQSIIIYCIRREQTERLAMLIRTCLKQNGDESYAEAYHAGLTAARRKSVQNRFMSGKLRIVVATVAFGMGLNKSDVRAVIHYNMPKNIESYVQEVGRAGRDGQPSYCHVFLEQTGEDKQELKRHIFSDTVERAALRKLLKRVFQPCKCNRLQELECSVSYGSREHDPGKGNPAESSKLLWTCPGHEIAFPVDETIDEIDLKEEGIETLLCYLELHPDRYVQLLNRVYGTCSIYCYGGSEQFKSLIKQCPPVAVGMAFQKQRKDGTISDNSITFPLVKVATLMGCESLFLKRQLLKLQWIEYRNDAGETKYRKSGIVVNFKDLSFHLRSVGTLTENQMDEVLDYLHNQVLRHEQRELEKLESFYRVLNSLSFAHHGACDGSSALKRSETLKSVIKEYFDDSSSLSKYASSDSVMPDNPLDTAGIRADIRNFLSIYKGEYTFTGRAVARIFHGIGSPRYPVEVWGRVRRFWRCRLGADFNELCKIATEEILRYR